MVPRPLQVMEATPPQGPIKDRRILPPRSQRQSDLTSETVESQVYSGAITRSIAKTLTYVEATSRFSVTTFNQGRDQFEK